MSPHARRRALSLALALGAAAIVAAIDPQIGEDDFRLSDMGADGDSALDAERPAVAYNSAENELLVVWQGTNTLDDLEIWAQRVEGGSGIELGVDFRISTMGNSPAFRAEDAAVAYSSVRNEYLVVWEGDDNTGGLVDGEFEIFGQRINGATGATIGDRIRISDMGTNGESRFDAENPDVAYNPTVDEYLVVWAGDDDRAPLVNGEFEIFGQRIDGATGAQIGSNDFRISQQGPGGDNDYDAGDPAVAYNSVDDEYLVVWEGDSPFGPLSDEEFEIWGQRLEGSNASLTGPDFRISQQKGLGVPRCDAEDPDVAYSPTQNAYLVVWEGDDYCEVDGNETEIFGQRISGAGTELDGDFRISTTGPENQVLDPYDAERPAVAWFGDEDEYYVVWQADDDEPPLVDGEFEIYGVRVAAGSGVLVDGIQRLSAMGPDGDNAFEAERPAITWDEGSGELLVVWHADDDGGELVQGEQEIYGQRLVPGAGPDLVLTALTATCGAGDDLDVSVTVDNLGLLAAGAFEVGIYASDGPDVDSGDAKIGSIGFAGGLAAGAQETVGAILDTSAILAGTYYVGGIADDLAAVEETVESNNDLVTAGRLTLPCSGPPCSLADADVTLTSQTLSGVSTIEACFTILVGPTVTFDPTAEITLRAGQAILFDDDVTVETGASLTVEIDSSLRTARVGAVGDTIRNKDRNVR